MFRKVKAVMITLVLNFGLVAGMGTTLVLAQDTAQVNCGASGTLTGVNCPTTGTADTTINNTIKRAIQLFQVVVGLISVFMLIVGGLKYITSGGESSNVQGAKNTILYAVIGLVVVGLAQVIVQFVLNRVNAPAGQI